MTQSGILPSEIGLSNIKFDTALIIERLRFYQQSSSQQKNGQLLQLSNQIAEAQIGVKNNILLTNILLSQTSHLSSKLMENFQLAHDVLILQEEHLLSNSTPKIQSSYYNKTLETYKHIIKFPNIIKSFVYGVEEINKVFQHMNKYKRINKFLRVKDTNEILREISYHSEGLEMTFIPIDGQILIQNYGSYHLLTADQFTMMHNKILEIRNVLITTWFLAGNIWTGKIFPEVVGILSFMNLQVRYLGNEAYEIFKNFDGIGSGLILMKDDLFDNNDPLEDIMGSLIRSRLISSQESRLLLKLFDGPTEEILEKTALSKLMGHPEIQTFHGIEKLRNRTFKSNSVSHEDVNILLCSMKKNFLHQYYLKHQKWPVLEMLPGCNPRLLYCRFNDIWIHDMTIPDHLPTVRLIDFSHINLLKVKEFDYVTSQFPILKDTALAALRSVIEDPFLHKIKDVRLQRTLLYFLLTNNPHTEVRKYLEQLRDHNPACLEYLVIKLTQKERELKSEGRMFGQSSYVERARRCILEYNVSKLMTAYNSSQGMTISELQKFQKLYILSRFPKDKPQYYSIYISVDVEAFNNNFRREVCEPVGKEFFNKLFGIPWYTNIMDTFESSLFLFSDGIVDCKWSGQYGGIEGLFQKFWTWIYESVASRVAEMTSFNHFVMVNGDDLRVVLLIPKSDTDDETDIKTLFSHISSSFHQNYQKFGFSLKVSETYFSSEYIGFGKLYLFKSRFCSTTLKKVAKTHGLANLMGDYPLEYLKGVMSETLSTMSYSTNHRFIYLVGLIQYIEYLDNFCVDFQELSLIEKTCLLLWPTNFGGLPILPYLRCAFKGDSDIETIWLSLLIFLCKHHKDIGSRLVSLWFNSITKANSYQGLAINPFSIPNNTPPEGLTAIKNFIRMRLPRICTNRHFLQVLTRVNPFQVEKYIKALFDCSPIPAKALSVIYSTSAAGLIDEFLEKFSTSKSIGGFLTKNFTSIGSIKILKKAKKMDLRKIKFCINLVKSNPSCYNIIGRQVLQRKYDHCPTKLSDDLRLWCYKRPIVGVTYPCVVDQIKIYDSSDPVNLQVKNYLTFWQYAVPEGVSINYSHGPTKIFIGNHTHLKLISPEVDINASTPGMSRVMKLLKIYSMLKNLGEACDKYIKKNLSDLTGMNADTLVEICYRHTSGSITHRVPTNHWSPLVAPNELSNRSSYIKSTTLTDHVSKTRAGDQTINYGLIRAYVHLIILYESEFVSWGCYNTNSTSWAEISSCESCTFEVTDVPVEWNCEVPDINFNLASNPYVSLTQDEYTILEQSISAVISTRAYSMYTNYDKTDPQLVKLCRKVMAFNLFEFCSDRLRTHQIDNDFMELPEEDLSSLLFVSSLDLVNLTDLKSIPFDYLLSALIDYITQWILTRYPGEFGTGEILHLLNEFHEKLPLKSISSMLLESSVWPVLRQYMITQKLTKLPLPPPNVDNATTLQLFLIKFSVISLMETQTTLTIFHDLQILPISRLPNEEQLSRLIRSGVNQLHLKYILHWLHSEDGRRFTAAVENSKYNLIKEELYELSLLTQNFPTGALEESFCCFQRKRSSSSCILITILTIIGVDQNQIFSQIMELLLEIDDEPTGVIINLFLNSKTQIVVLPTHEVTSIVREGGNALYQEYFTRSISQAVIPLLSTTDDGSPRHTSRKFAKKIELIFTIEPSNFDYLVYDSRLERIWTKFQRITFTHIHSMSLVLGQLGGTTGKLFPEILTISSIINRTTIGTTIMTTNDYHGTYAVAFANLYPNATILPISCNYDDISKLPPLSDIYSSFPSIQNRIKLGLINGYIGNISDKTHQQLIISEEGTLKEIIFINYNNHLINQMIPSEFLNLLPWFISLLTTTGCLIIKVKIQRFPTNFFLFLQSLCQNFNNIQMYRSRVTYHGFPTIYFKLSSVTDSTGRAVFTSRGLHKLYSELSYQPSVVSDILPIYSNLSDTLRSMRSWKFHLGLRNTNLLASRLQTITIGLITNLHQPTLIDFQQQYKEYLSSEVSRLHSRLSYLMKNPTGSSNQDFRHQTRILLETIAARNMIDLIGDRLHEFLQNPGYEIGEVIKTASTTAQTDSTLNHFTNLPNIVDDQWLVKDFLYYITNVFEMLMWIIIKYHFDM